MPHAAFYCQQTAAFVLHAYSTRRSTEKTMKSRRIIAPQTTQADFAQGNPDSNYSTPISPPITGNFQRAFHRPSRPLKIHSSQALTPPPKRPGRFAGTTQIDPAVETDSQQTCPPPPVRCQIAQAQAATPGLQPLAPGQLAGRNVYAARTQRNGIPLLIQACIAGCQSP